MPTMGLPNLCRRRDACGSNASNDTASLVEGCFLWYRKPSLERSRTGETCYTVQQARINRHITSELSTATKAIKCQQDSTTRGKKARFQKLCRR
mmetsp:Transcript_32638/g.74581  ORF Transcript_32638/g.74581 Transcript_32638/m.74581 type:complete len:94 (-) Transcript_32638:2280-2561(-)